MSDAPPDFSTLARRYLDLWQKQVAALTNDPALAEVVAQGLAVMAQAPAAFAEAATAGVGHPVHEAPTADAGTPSVPIPDDAPAGPPAVDAASGGARGDIDELARRLAAVEERLAALEAQLGGRGGDPAPKPGRRRAKRVD